MRPLGAARLEAKPGEALAFTVGDRPHRNVIKPTKKCCSSRTLSRLPLPCRRRRRTNRFIGMTFAHCLEPRARPSGQGEIRVIEVIGRGKPIRSRYTELSRK